MPGADRGGTRARRARGASEPPASRVRLQKLLAAAGIASRRRAETLIREGRVTVNGATARIGDAADPQRDDVRLDGERLRAERADYWLVHKPLGVLTSVSDPEGRPVVVDLLPGRRARLFPVGRLDRETSGLVLLTNDGPLAHALLHPSHEVEREYVVTVAGELDRTAQQRLAEGVRLEEGPTAPAKLTRVRYDPARDETHFHLTLHEGRKRQIRRSLLVLGHRVRALARIRMGPLRLGTLAPGEARRLEATEVRALEALAAQIAERAAAGAHAQRRGKRSAKARARQRKPRAPRGGAEPGRALRVRPRPRRVSRQTRIHWIPIGILV